MPHTGDMPTSPDYRATAAGGWCQHEYPDGGLCGQHTAADESRCLAHADDGQPELAITEAVPAGKER